MSVRESFVARFGEGQAAAIEAAAEGHKNGCHDNPGSDYFRWAIAICIGFECMSNDSYRTDHGITAPWDEIRAWIKADARLAEHDGDSDYLALFCGHYNEFMPEAGGEVPR